MKVPKLWGLEVVQVGELTHMLREGGAPQTLTPVLRTLLDPTFWTFSSGYSCISFILLFVINWKTRFPEVLSYFSRLRREPEERVKKPLSYTRLVRSAGDRQPGTCDWRLAGSRFVGASP